MNSGSNNSKMLIVITVLFLIAGDAVKTWDLGVVTQGQIQFFTNNVIDKTVDIPLGRMIAMAYDPTRKDLYVRANNNEFGGVFRIKTTGDRAYAAVEPIVGKQPYQIVGMAFNEQTSILYWTTGNVGTVNYVHVPENRTKELLKGRVLLGSESDQSLFKLAIDVCRGYLYWIKKVDLKHYKIERSRLNGSERRDVIRVNGYINDMVIDVERNMLYWITGDKNPENYAIECSELDGAFRRTLYTAGKTEMNHIAVFAGKIYWANWNSLYNFSRNKYGTGIKPKTLAVFTDRVDQLITSTRSTPINVNNTCVAKRKKIAGRQVLTQEQKSMLLCQKNGVVRADKTCLCNVGQEGKYCELRIGLRPSDRFKTSGSATAFCPYLVLHVFAIFGHYYY